MEKEKEVQLMGGSEYHAQQGHSRRKCVVQQKDVAELAAKEQRVVDKQVAARHYVDAAK
jgi:hypothetical protein